jgi:hypothetical protein
MAGIVSLRFQGAKFTGSTFSIAVGGGAIVVETNPSLSLSGNIPLTGLSIASGAISINGQAGATVNGNINFPVNITGGGAPTVTVNNFSGPATISWPSNSGPQVQSVASDVPIILSGFSN